MQIIYSFGLRSVCYTLIAMLCLLAAQAASAAETTLIRNVRIIDGTGAAATAPSDLLIEGEVIKAIAPAGEATVPEGASVVDLEGKTIIPGLIATHSHIGQVDGLTSTPAVYNRDNILRQLRQFEAYGVTTVVALGLNRPLFYDIQKEIQQGTVRGADVLGADRGIGVIGGNPGGNALRFAGDQLDRPETPEQAREMVRASKERGADYVKIWLDDSRGAVPKMRKEIYTAVIEEAHSHGLKVASHIFTLQDAKDIIEAGVDIIAHGVRDQPVDPQLIQLLKEHSVWYVPTLALDDADFAYADHPEWLDSPFFLNSLQPALRKQIEDADWQKGILESPRTRTRRDNVQMNQRNVKILHDSGVKIAFGTDSGAFAVRIPGFAEHREMELLAQAGFQPLEIITIATKNSAEALGLEDRGTLTVGQRADFVVLNHDPSEEITLLQEIDAVWQRGKKTSGSILEFTP